ncbi:MAG: hypothetical protein ACP5KE_09410, partial [Candidatus Methanodesulfokora sp.]
LRAAIMRRITPIPTASNNKPGSIRNQFAFQDILPYHIGLSPSIRLNPAGILMLNYIPFAFISFFFKGFNHIVINYHQWGGDEGAVPKACEFLLF